MGPSSSGAMFDAEMSRTFHRAAFSCHRLAFVLVAHRRAVHRKSDQRRVDTRFRLLKYCSGSEPSLENFGGPALRFGERLDFSLSFCERHPAAWPAAFQITCKNNAESSLFELLCDVFSKNFQSSMPFLWFLMFISFYERGITGCIKFYCMTYAVYRHLWRRSRTSLTTTF